MHTIFLMKMILVDMTLTHVWVHVDHKGIRDDVEGLGHVNLCVSVLTNRGHAMKPVWNDTQIKQSKQSVFSCSSLKVSFYFLCN